MMPVEGTRGKPNGEPGKVDATGETGLLPSSNANNIR
jgi:hypothetical protein